MPRPGAEGREGADDSVVKQERGKELIARHQSQVLLPFMRTSERFTGRPDCKTRGADLARVARKLAHQVQLVNAQHRQVLGATAAVCRSCRWCAWPPVSADFAGADHRPHAEHLGIHAPVMGYLDLRSAAAAAVTMASASAGVRTKGFSQ